MIANVVGGKIVIRTNWRGKHARTQRCKVKGVSCSRNYKSLSLVSFPTLQSQRNKNNYILKQEIRKPVGEGEEGESRSVAYETDRQTDRNRENEREIQRQRNKERQR